MEKTFYTEQTIGSIFAGVLADALAEGFVPCMTERQTLGSFGSPVILARGNERIVLFIVHGNSGDRWDIGDPLRWNADVVDVKYVRFTIDNTRPKWVSYDHAEKDAETLSTLVEIDLGRAARRKTLFVADEDVAREMMAKHDARNYGTANKVIGDYTRKGPYELTDALLDTVRKFKGFKTVDSRYIQVKGGDGRYWIENTKSGNTTYVCVPRHNR